MFFIFNFWLFFFFKSWAHFARLIWWNIPCLSSFVCLGFMLWRWLRINIKKLLVFVVILSLSVFCRLLGLDPSNTRYNFYTLTCKTIPYFNIFFLYTVDVWCSFTYILFIRKNCKCDSVLLWSVLWKATFLVLTQHVKNVSVCYKYAPLLDLFFQERDKCIYIWIFYAFCAFSCKRLFIFSNISSSKARQSWNNQQHVQWLMAGLHY